jgi:Family of unknown function (DUF6535)
VEKFHLPLAVETLPTLLHVSLFLFFSGLLVFLFNINHTTFSVIACWVGLSGGIYGCIALLPIFRHDSPYYTPLTFSAWFLLNGISYEVFRILTFITYFDYFTGETWTRFRKMRETYRERTSSGIVKTAQERASKMSAEIDGYVLKWTFDALDEDRELEQFFEAVPAFCTSQVVHEPRRMLSKLDMWDFTAACDGFLIRTFSSRLLSERTKERRFILCMQAIDALNSLFPSSDFCSQVFGPPAMDGVLQSVQMGHLLRSRCHGSKGLTAFRAQMLVAGIIANVPEHDDRWKVLVMDQLRISENILEDYLTHGDSVLLANWIHITRQSFRFNLCWASVVLGKIQSSISKFDIGNTLPELQHDFCALWNRFTREAHNRGTPYIAYSVLKPNRHHFIALHQGTEAVPTAFDASTNGSDPILDQPSSYPLCNVPGHHSDGATGETTHSLIHSPPVHPPDADLNSVAFAAPDVPSLPAFTPDQGRINLTEQSSPHDVPHATPTIQSSHLSPVNVGSNDFSITLPDPALTIAPVISPTGNLGSDTRPAMVASTAISPLLPSSGAVNRQYNADLDVDSPSMVPDIPSPSTPVPVSNDTLPADPLMSSKSACPTLQINLITPGSRLLTQGSVPEISFTPPQVTSNLQPNLPENDATFDTRDSSRAPELSNIVETSQQSHESATPTLDTVTDLSRHPVDRAPSRDVDRP